MTHKLGREANAHILAQAVTGVAAEGDFNRLLYYSLTPNRAKPKETDPLIGRTLHNPLDAQEPADGLVTASLDLVTPLCFNHMGLLLPLLFNASAPSGAGPYVHAYASGQRETAGASIVWKEDDDWEQTNTWVPQSMELGFAQESGRRQVRWSGPCSDIKPVGSDPTGTPVVLPESIMPAGPGCIIRKNATVVARVTGGTARFNRRLEPFRPAGNADAVATEFTPDVGSRFEGDFTMRVLDNTFRDFANEGGVDDFEFEYALSADAKLVIALPAVRFEPTKRPVLGQDLRSETFRWMGEQTASAAGATLTLTNGTATYTVET